MSGLVLHWPQITMLVLYGLSLVIGAAEHGKPKKGDHNVITNILGVGVSFWILWSGGFYTGGL